MQKERRTDRRNFSAVWNRYLETYGVSLLRTPESKKGFRSGPLMMFNLLVDLVNHDNEKVADALMIPNPDRINQYLLVPRESAQKILVLGMI